MLTDAFSIRSQNGFTLIELLVAMVAGLMVSFAAFAILDASLTQSSRIADRTSADQRGRIAMEKIMLKLHSSCVAAEVTPVEPKSEGNKLLIVSDVGSTASFSNVELHEISFTEKGGKGTLTDTTYLNTPKYAAPNWEFSTEPHSREIIITGVSRSENPETKSPIPIFQYFRYEGNKLSTTPLSGELSEKSAAEVAAITVSFTTNPESETIGKIAGDRTVDLSNTAVLRFSPASSTVTNRPCD